VERLDRDGGGGIGEVKSLSVICAMLRMLQGRNHNALLLDFFGHHPTDLRVQHILVVVDHHIRQVDEVSRDEVGTPKVLESDGYGVGE
jgi:hypothetical protein